MSDKTKTTKAATGAKATAKPAKPELLDYEATADGWAGGRRIAKDEVVQMTETAARYETLLVRKGASKT